MPSSKDAPPATLDCALEVGPDEWRAPGFYQLLTALVVPRPVGWISTISKSGVRNLAPYSYFNLMGRDPPHVAFGSTGVKDSLQNLREVPEFVADIVTMHLVERMNSPRETSTRGGRIRLGTFDTGTVGEGTTVSRRRGQGASRCEVAQIVTDRNTNIVLGRIRSRPCRCVGVEEWPPKW